MAEDSDLERTEPASPRKLEKAREEGDVPRSKELSTVSMLLALGSAIWFLGDSLVRHLMRFMTSMLSLERDWVYDPILLFEAIKTNLLDVLVGFSPLAAIALLVGAGTPILIGGWVFTANAFFPKFSRLNPIQGLSNLVSKNAGVELVKAIIKAIFIGSVAWFTVSGQSLELMGLMLQPFPMAAAHFGGMLWKTYAVIVGSLVLIAVIDVMYQIWHYAEKHKMTKEEVRQESKETDGNPEIKGKIRAQQREIARRRMMQEVPKSDVVVTNPTHFAVALKYEDGNGAPRVVAKGADEVAAKIRELAAANNVPLLEAPPLARALHFHAEVGDQIPEALYSAVAEILAYVYQLRVYREKGGNAPNKPSSVGVPGEMDPFNPAFAGHLKKQGRGNKA